MIVENNEKKLSSYEPVEEQWRTTCQIEFDEPRLPDNELPRLDIKPFHIFGYRAKDAHNNVKYINSDNILYCAGKIGIIQNISNRQQKYFNEHKNEISALCINKDKNLIATGEDNIKDKENYQIRIWDINLEELGVIDINYPIKALSFNLNSKYLVCCCSDEKHNVLLIDVNRKEILDEVSGSEKKIIGLAFKSNDEFATVGINHFKYWIINRNTNKLNFKEYVNNLDNFDDKLGVISVSDEHFVTGSFLGYITLWKEQINIKMKKYHKSQIDSLYCDDKLIISGARDKIISILDNELTILKRIDLNNILNQQISANCSPKSIDIVKYKEIKDIKKILLGTYSGDILELSFKNNILKDSEEIDYEIINSSHFCENSSETIEITSINYSAKSNLFVTTGKDRTIRFWNSKEKTQTKFFKLEDDSKPTSAAFSFKEDKFIVGFDSGDIKFFDAINFSVIDKIKERNNTINVIKCSNTDLVACATNDEKGNHVIDVYFIESKNKYCTLRGAQNNIDGIDWSEDGKYLVSFSHNKECRIFNIAGKYMMSIYSELNNLKWNSWSLGYGWPLKGYYDGNYGKIPIYTSERFKLDNEEIFNIAIGDNTGSIKLFKFPIFSKDQKAVTNYNYHAKEITHMKFGSIDGKYILISSSSDGVLIAWEIKKI